MAPGHPVPVQHLSLAVAWGLLALEPSVAPPPPPPSDAPGRPAGAEVGPGTVGDLDVADLEALDPTARAERAIAHAAQKVCGGRTV